MAERQLARYLFAAGMLTVSGISFFDFRWADAGLLTRVGFVAGVVAATVGLALDIKHRRENERRFSAGS